MSKRKNMDERHIIVEMELKMLSVLINIKYIMIFNFKFSKNYSFWSPQMFSKQTTSNKITQAEDIFSNVACIQMRFLGATPL